MGRTIECLDRAQIVIEETADSKLQIAWVVSAEGKKGKILFISEEDSDEAIAKKLDIVLKNRKRSTKLWGWLTAERLVGARISWHTSHNVGPLCGGTSYNGEVGSVEKTTDKLVMRVVGISSNYSIPFGGREPWKSEPDTTVTFNRYDDYDGKKETGYLEITHYQGPEQETKKSKFYRLHVQVKQVEPKKKEKKLQIFPFNAETEETAEE